MPKNIELPDIAPNKSDQKYINEAIKYVEKNFPKNYGNTENFIDCEHHQLSVVDADSDRYRK